MRHLQLVYILFCLEDALRFLIKFMEYSQCEKMSSPISLLIELMKA